MHSCLHEELIHPSDNLPKGGILDDLHQDLIKDIDQDPQRFLLRSIRIFTVLVRILKDHDHILKDLQRFLKILEDPSKNP